MQERNSEYLCYKRQNIENIAVEDVLYVPKLAANLLSVSKITKKRFQIY